MIALKNFVLGGEKYSIVPLISQKSYQLFFRHMIRFTAFLETRSKSGMRNIGDIGGTLFIIKLDQTESRVRNPNPRSILID
jgi:hypothetical protein